MRLESQRQAPAWITPFTMLLRKRELGTKTKQLEQSLGGGEALMKLSFREARETANIENTEKPLNGRLLNKEGIQWGGGGVSMSACSRGTRTVSARREHTSQNLKASVR